MDSNHDKQIQNLQCYRYTTRQKGGLLLHKFAEVQCKFTPGYNTAFGNNG